MKLGGGWTRDQSRLLALVFGDANISRNCDPLSFYMPPPA